MRDEIRGVVLGFIGQSVRDNFFDIRVEKMGVENA